MARLSGGAGADLSRLSGAELVFEGFEHMQEFVEFRTEPPASLAFAALRFDFLFGHITHPICCAEG